MIEGLHIRPVADDDDRLVMRKIRDIVFIQEQDVPIEIEFDEFDSIGSDDPSNLSDGNPQGEHAEHFLAILNGKAVGCCRFRQAGDWTKLERIAVYKEFRGKGIGEAMMQFLLDKCVERGYEMVYLHAQCQSQGFYAKMGFEPVGDIFDEAGIDHTKMVWKQ